MRSLLKAAEVRDGFEEEGRLARDILDVLKVRDQAILKYIRHESASPRAIETLRLIFEADRVERLSLAKRETLLDISPDVRSDLMPYFGASWRRKRKTV